LRGETAGKTNIERKDEHKVLVRAEQEQALRIVKVQKMEAWSSDSRASRLVQERRGFQDTASYFLGS